MQTSPPPTVDTATGLVRGVRQVLATHCDERPPGCVPTLIVVHGISLPPGEFGGPWIDRLFTGALPAAAHPYFRQIEGLRASAHALIRRDGQVVQYVPFQLRAWHAGKSEYQGRSGCNDFSIGIELEGTDEHALHRSAVRSARRADHGAARCVPDAVGAGHRRPQRRRAGTQDRSRPGLRLAAPARAAWGVNARCAR